MVMVKLLVKLSPYYYYSWNLVVDVVPVSQFEGTQCLQESGSPPLF